MKQLLLNLRLFLTGFAKLNGLTYQPGWGPKSFGLVYLIDYGSHVLTGAAVVSWSRWFYENRKRYHWAAFCNRLLNHLDDDHGAESGPALWGSVDCEPAVRLALVAGWIGLAVLL